MIEESCKHCRHFRLDSFSFVYGWCCWVESAKLPVWVNKMTERRKVDKSQRQCPAWEAKS